MFRVVVVADRKSSRAPRRCADLRPARDLMGDVRDRRRRGRCIARPSSRHPSRELREPRMAGDLGDRNSGLQGQGAAVDGSAVIRPWE